MKKFFFALVLCLAFAIVAGCAGEETPTSTPSESPAPVPPAEPETVTIVDGTGKYVEIALPVERIISIAEGRSSELICAFGDVDKIVGRDSLSTFPSYLSQIEEVASSSYNPNVELILEKKPDLVIAGVMLNLVPGVRDKIEAAGVPVIIDSPGNPDRLIPFISNLGIILDKKDKAEEIIDYIGQYRQIVQKRIMGVEAENKPSVFFEWRGIPYNSCSAEGLFHQTLVEAGAVNIAAGEPIDYPKVNAEWVFTRNPNVIISQHTTADMTLEEMASNWEAVKVRPGLSQVKAVQDDRVYVINYAIMAGTRYHVGLLAFARWCHPDLFCDIDVAAIHQETVEKFFGEEEWARINTAVYYPEFGPTRELPEPPSDKPSGMPGGMPGSMK
jgi:iron complex transport system substrate-binding protein